MTMWEPEDEAAWVREQKEKAMNARKALTKLRDQHRAEMLANELAPLAVRATIRDRQYFEVLALRDSLPNAEGTSDELCSGDLAKQREIHDSYARSSTAPMMTATRVRLGNEAHSLLLEMVHTYGVPQSKIDKLRQLDQEWHESVPSAKERGQE